MHPHDTPTEQDIADRTGDLMDECQNKEFIETLDMDYELYLTFLPKVIPVIAGWDGSKETALEAMRRLKAGLWVELDKIATLELEK